MYLTQFFDGKNEEKEKQQLPKQFFKSLLQLYKKKHAALYFKLFFDAFSRAYENDFTLIYQFFVTIIQIIGFDLNDKVIFHKTSKLNISNEDLSLRHSTKILLSILEVMIHVKIDSNVLIKNISMSNFLKNLFIEFLYFNQPCKITYDIFLKMLTTDPLIIQSVTEETIGFAMLTNNSDCTFEYNKLITSIFDTYSRLHRVESLISKMIGVLDKNLHEESSKINSLYAFRGKINLNKNRERTDINVEQVLTKEILECFGKSIEQLASWQVVNVFKTLVHFLNQVLRNIDNTENENNQHCIFVQILSELIKHFLSSIRIAEHTVATNVAEKCMKCLTDLKNCLRIFGEALVKREHVRLYLDIPKSELIAIVF